MYSHIMLYSVYCLGSFCSISNNVDDPYWINLLSLSLSLSYPPPEPFTRTQSPRCYRLNWRPIDSISRWYGVWVNFVSAKPKKQKRKKWREKMVTTGASERVWERDLVNIFMDFIDLYRFGFGRFIASTRQSTIPWWKIMTFDVYPNIHLIH